MRIALLISIFASLILVSSVEAQSVEQDDSKEGSFDSRCFEFPALTDADRENRKVPMKLHMPVGDSSFPVVMFSHGAGGNWDSNFAQARHLASHGYAVVCLEHVGSNTNTALAGGLRLGKTIAAMTENSGEVINRPKDVSFGIDQVTKWSRSHKELRRKLDLKRIGMIGHSFGAYTTLTVCGARPALDWIRPRIGKGSGLGPDLSEKRILCGVALSPQGPGKPFFLQESYESIQVPLLGISGSRDKQQHFQPNHRKASFKYWPKGDRFLLWISNANHMSFSDSTGSKPRRRSTSRAAEYREEVQSVSRAATLLFFNKYLRKLPDVDFSQEKLTGYAKGVAEDISLMEAVAPER